VFLVTLGTSAWIQMRDGREEAVVEAINDIDMLAALSAAKLSGADAENQDAAANRLAELVKELPAGALARGRMLLLADGTGTVRATHPKSATAPRSLSDLLGEAQPLMLFAERAGVMTIKLATGQDGIATVRSLGGSTSQIAVVQPLANVLGNWWARTLGQLSLLGAAAVVLIGIGIAYFMQANRAQAANEVCEKVRDRIDSALNRGRCGLWDWDIPRGRIYWSDSMYDVLGYERRDEFLSFGEVNAMVHPEDTDLPTSSSPHAPPWSTTSSASAT
jgi:two-component system cell cycle sensor histidine kinase PleC